MTRREVDEIDFVAPESTRMKKEKEMQPDNCHRDQNGGEPAQPPVDALRWRFRKRGGRIGICGVHTILHDAVKLEHAWQSTSPDAPENPESVIEAGNSAEIAGHRRCGNAGLQKWANSLIMDYAV
ncbi:MAG: hypothetical protein ABSG80_11485 [Verrucomicrobiota bacterium]|jgi:hypothetical protein